jgi:carbonic anhydrase
MGTVLNEVVSANRDYSASFDKGELAIPPGRRFTLKCLQLAAGM